MDWRDRIGADQDVLVGEPVIKGTRIAVELVLELLAAGYTTEQIRQQYDHLTAQDIQACLAYAREVVESERMFTIKG
ncbi:MAG: antitoxin [Acidobacteria bacterium]|nr:MAG: antitoxin [Acidobacteriota bacterium]